MSESALIIVDAQQDFLPGGVLGTDDADQMARAISALTLIERLARKSSRVIATRDWHPPDHCSFSPEPTYEDGSWPVHCVQGTPGARLHPSVEAVIDAVVSKGMERDHEQYSGFQGHIIDDEGEHVARRLDSYLTSLDVNRLVICGFVTEFCVKSTVLSACALGYDVTVDAKATSSLTVEGSTEALKLMLSAGAKVLA